MKKVTVIVLMLMFCVSSVCMARIPQDQVAVGGIGYGSSREYVESIYGKPTSEKRVYDKNKRLHIVAMYGKYLHIYYDLKDNTIVDLSYYGDNSLATPAGVTCGMDLSVLRNIYGTADNIYSAHGGTIYVYAGTESNGKNHGVMEFDVRNGKIHQIEIW